MFLLPAGEFNVSLEVDKTKCEVSKAITYRMAWDTSQLWMYEVVHEPPNVLHDDAHSFLQFCGHADKVVRLYWSIAFACLLECMFFVTYNADPRGSSSFRRRRQSRASAKATQAKVSKTGFTTTM